MRIFILLHKDTKSTIMRPGGVNKHIHVGDVFGGVGILEQQAETVCHRSLYSDYHFLQPFFLLLLPPFFFLDKSFWLSVHSNLPRDIVCVSFPFTGVCSTLCILWFVNVIILWGIVFIIFLIISTLIFTPFSFFTFSKMFSSTLLIPFATHYFSLVDV